MLLALIFGILASDCQSFKVGCSYSTLQLWSRAKASGVVPQIRPTGNDSSRSRRDTSALNGIAEWRDCDFGLPGSEPQLGLDQGGRGPPKSVCLLPFPFREVLLQGETKQLRLYEDRFIKLFRDVVDNHHGVVAMGLMADSGVVQTVPLCEVEAYNTMEGFGIFVTIVVVGRALLLEISQQEPYIKGTCMEISDNIPPNLELPNLLAGNIENSMLLLSSMEHRLNQARKNNEIEDKEMERRITIAKWEGRFNMPDEDEEDDDDDDEKLTVDDEDDEDEPVLDRLGRFRRSYEVALRTDTQGYRIAPERGPRESTLSPRELTAISWAAFCTELVPGEDVIYRIQAMDADNLFERLKLAFKMIQTKKAQLRAKMQKAGIEDRRDETDGNGSSLDKSD